MTSASDPNSAYAFAYNGDGQVTSTDNNGTPNVPHVVLTAGYDLAGDITSQSATIAGTKDFLNNYFYDADQRLTTVQQEQQTGGNTVANKEIDYAYNAIGQFTAIGYYNQFNGPRTDIATGAFTYDTDNRLTGLAYTANAGQTSIDSFGYAYNAGSLVTSFTSNDGTASYAYDPTDQLTSATYTTNSGGHQPANESYSFTNNGNRNMTGWTTGSDNTITSDGTFNYSHDADGNQTVRTRISNNYASDYRTTYSWDYRNRLTDVEYFDNNSVLTKHVHYVYDVFNDLIATQVDTTGSGSYNITQRYVVGGGQPALEFDKNGNLIQRNLVAPDPAGVDAVMAQGAVSSLNQADVVTWILDDNEGTPRDIVNNSSTVVNHIVYASFGQDVYESNSAYTHWNGFGGSHNDTYTGLNLNGRRWDDPSTGKWLSQDPIDFLGGDADISRAVGNNPTNRIDPSGLADNPVPTTQGPIPNHTYAAQQALKQAAIQAMGGPEAAAAAIAAMAATPNKPPVPATPVVSSIPFNTFAAQQGWAWSTSYYVWNGGCQSLITTLAGTPPQYMPYSAPGAIPFTNFGTAQTYYADQLMKGNHPALIAYQVTAPMGALEGGKPSLTPGWTPPAPGAIDPMTIPAPSLGNKNFSILVPDPATWTKNWVWMSNSRGPISSAPLNTNAPMNGLYPNSGVTMPGGALQPFQTAIYVVYVPPPLRPQPPSFPWWISPIPGGPFGP